MNIKIKYLKYALNLEIRDKITVISGKGASGKTTMIRTFKNKTSSHIYWEISDSNLIGRVIGDLEDLKEESNSNIKNKVYLIDESRIPFDSELVNLIKNAVNCYFILIRRTNSDNINFSPSNLLEIKEHGRVLKGILLFREYYHIDIDRFTGFDFVIIEDIKYGCEWWRRLMYKSKAKFIIAGGIDSSGNILSEIVLDGDNYKITTVKVFNKNNLGGKSKVVDSLAGIYKIKKSASILLVIDFCSFGSQWDKFRLVVNKYRLNVTYFSNYLSYEECILKSNMFKDRFIEYNAEKRDFEEAYYEQHLANLTKDTNMSTNHSNQSSLSYCYYKECCCYKDRKNCKNGLKSTVDKFVEMFNGTEHEEFLYMAERKC